MRLLSIFRLSFLAITVSFLFSCDEKEELSTENMTDFIPLAAGKYITYRLDSTVFTGFNKVMEVHRYQVKHVVDALVTDNLGRSSYRVYRYIRDSAGLNPWTPNGSYFITPSTDETELIENNLRVIKLHMPVKQDFNWKGNRYLPNAPYSALFNFSNDDFMEDWDFTYQSLNQDYTTNGRTYTNVCTVEEVDDALNAPVTIPGAFGFKSRAVERYSKGIGLVTRELTMYEYQPDPNGGANYAYFGFGINMWMIDHN